MHPEVEKVWALWEKEQARDVLLSEWRGLHEAKKKLAEEVEAAAAKTADSTAARDAIAADEKQLNRKLESYQKRLARAKKSIDTGTASDFRLAQAQVEQCTAIIDEVETELLEVMEQLEDAQELEKRAQNGEAHLRHRLEAAEKKHDERLPTLKPEFEGATSVRDAAREGLWRDSLSRYDMLRKKKLAVFAYGDGATCSGCHSGMDGTRYSTLHRDVELVTCRHCGRFLRMQEG